MSIYFLYGDVSDDPFSKQNYQTVTGKNCLPAAAEQIYRVEKPKFQNLMQTI